MRHDAAGSTKFVGLEVAMIVPAASAAIQSFDYHFTNLASKAMIRKISKTMMASPSNGEMVQFSISIRLVANIGRRNKRAIPRRA